MRNKYIKFCDQHNISDGILREMLYKGNDVESFKAIEEAVDKRNNEIDSLVQLKILIENDGDKDNK